MSDLSRHVRAVTGARAARVGAEVQSLWSGYGAVVRVHLQGASVPSVVVKRVDPPAGRGRGHERKLRSYAVEAHWYGHWSRRCACRVPACLDVRETSTGWLFVLEDLDAAGFAGRRRRVSDAQLDLCLQWLARFHATFLGAEPEGLWPVGTYWHLATRPDELAATSDPALRRAAPILDARLSATSFPTLVHGDAKLANFCFGDGAVAAVDFQYVGGGCGMKDVAYLLGEALHPSEGRRAVARWLDCYFAHLRAEVADADALEADWRPLFAIAEADFSRFLAGWAPGHWARDRAGQRQLRAVVRSL